MPVPRVVALCMLATLMLSLGVVPVAGGRPASAQKFTVFATMQYDVTPIGVFKNYVIGYRSTPSGNELVAVNMYNGSETPLGILETFGVNLKNMSMQKTSDYFMITDKHVAVIWDRNLHQVGRFAQDTISGIAILRNGYLVAWGNDVVTVFKSPNFVHGKQYDIWSSLYDYMLRNEIPPAELLRLSGRNPDTITSELSNQLIETISSENGTLVSGPTVIMSYNLTAQTPVEARKKFPVVVVSATYINGIVYAAVNANITIDVVATAVYSVSTNESSTVENATVEEEYHVSLGFLVATNGTENGTIVKEVYAGVEAGATSSVMCYVYVPLMNQSISPKMIKVIFENGTEVARPLYTSSTVESVRIAGPYVFVTTKSGVLLVYGVNGDLVASLAVKKLVDVGEAGNNIYLTYVNGAGALELGKLTYSGRYEKYVIETPMLPVGAYIGNGGSLVFFAGESQGKAGVVVATSSPLADVEVRFVDTYGNLLRIIQGTAHIIFGNLTYEEATASNPVILRVPTPAEVYVTVRAPYATKTVLYDVKQPGTHRYRVVVRYPFPLGNPHATNATTPFFNPFSKGLVIVEDKELMKYRLPGASAIDAYGVFLALVEASNLGNSTSVLDLYRVDGTLLYTKTFPEVVEQVKFFFPYLVVKGAENIYVLDAPTGTVKATLTLPAKGYDLDLDSDYLSAWTSSIIAVLDLRTHATVYMDMSRYGAVLVAPVIDGLVYAYVAGKSGISIYVINPIDRGIETVLPWNGDSVVGFVSDGHFHVVSYVSGKTYYMDVISCNGLTTIKGGPAVWVRTIGNYVDMPQASKLYGILYAALATERSGVCKIYVVGANYELLGEITGMPEKLVRFAPAFIAEAKMPANATPLIVLRDYSGTPRLTIVASAPPALLAVSNFMVAYGDASKVYMIPNPTAVGKYKLVLKIMNEEGQPLNATVWLRPFNIKLPAKNGMFEAYLSVPGTYRVEVSASFYVPKEVAVTLTDQSPVAFMSVYLKPQLYRLTVKVTTGNGEPAKEGIIKIEGITNKFRTVLNVTAGKANTLVRAGTYSVSYFSDLYSPAKATVKVVNNTQVVLVVNRTHIKLGIYVTNQEGDPIPNATITISSKSLPAPINITTNQEGFALAYLPYNITFNVTVSAPRYRTAQFTNLTATEELEASQLRVHLKKIMGALTIITQEKGGKSLTAKVTIRDMYGNIVQQLTVTGATTIDLDLGTYTVEGTTSDGRTASAMVTLTEHSPVATAKLVFNPKPQPMYVRIFPYLIIVVIVATVIVLVYRKYSRGKPRKVG